MEFKVAARIFGAGGSGPKVLIYRFTPTMFWVAVRELPNALPNVNIFVHDNVRCDGFVLGL